MMRTIGARIVLVAMIASVLAFGAYVRIRADQRSTRGVSVSDIKTFVEWSIQHGKQYATSEEKAHRLALFVKALTKVNIHNSKNLSYRIGLNQFSDMEIEEVKAKHFGLAKSPSDEIRDIDYSLLNGVPSNDVDWVSKGAVTPVKNQGDCGSCWAFSSTGALEGIDFLYNKLTTINSYSEQQLVDCSVSYGNEGCNGGDMPFAFKYVQRNGITYEREYPYAGIDMKCYTKKGHFTIKGYKYVPPKSSHALAYACDQQPIALSVDAEKIIPYSSGIFDDVDCGTEMNHGVLLTGYTSDYWTVKNSWSKKWGESGYIRFSRTAVSDSKGGVCGLLFDNCFPIME